MPARSFTQEQPSDTSDPLSQQTEEPREPQTDAPDSEVPRETFIASEATPEERLAAARDAFREGDFARIRPLLEDVLLPRPRLSSGAQRNEARQLFGVGLFFEAQQVTDATQRRALLDTAKSQFLELLRERPDFQMDPLLYPASVVELFEDVRQENAEELEALMAEMGGKNDDGAVDTLYVERTIEKRNLAFAFFPFGFGQFQNGDEVKGTLFAVAQGLSLGLNITSYLVIENLRNESGDGRLDTGADGRSGAFAEALTWRRVMYVSLASFALTWAGSIVDAILNFEQYDVSIRALDAPPPELGPAEPSGTDLNLPLGWSIEWKW